MPSNNPISERLHDAHVAKVTGRCDGPLTSRMSDAYMRGGWDRPAPASEKDGCLKAILSVVLGLVVVLGGGILLAQRSQAQESPMVAIEHDATIITASVSLYGYTYVYTASIDVDVVCGCGPDCGTISNTLPITVPEPITNEPIINVPGPVVTDTPSITPLPEPGPMPESKCNNGIGNGAEGCDSAGFERKGWTAHDEQDRTGPGDHSEDKGPAPKQDQVRDKPDRVQDKQTPAQKSDKGKPKS